MRYTEWLIKIQNSDGSWCEPSGKVPHTFDTGQILKGLVEMVDIVPGARESLRKGSEWLITQIGQNGHMTTPDQTAWRLSDGSLVDDRILLYTLEPLRTAATLLNRGDFEDAAQRALKFYLAQRSLTDFDSLSHFHAYVLEALVDLGAADRAAEGMEVISSLQRKDGTVPAYRNARWICSTGIAQYAVIWYRLGQEAKADRAYDAVLNIQNDSGGFFGGYGRKANYFPADEISWAVKYFLDATNWKLKTSFESTAPIFPETIEASDGRFQVVKNVVASKRPKVVADVGCGKGRFIKLLKTQYPEIEAVGIDISAPMLSLLPEGVSARLGSLLRLREPDASVDLAFTVEALEHAINIPAAIRELARIVKPGGILVIVDKNRAALGKLKISAWEQWFDEDEVTQLLAAQGFSVEVLRNIPYASKDGSNGLFLGWIATRRA